MEKNVRPAVILLTAGNEPRGFDPDIVAGSVRKPFDVELLNDTVTACMTVLASVQQVPGCPVAESEQRTRTDASPAGIKLDLIDAPKGCMKCQKMTQESS